MKIKLIEIAVGLSLLICLISCLTFKEDCDSIRDKIVRLHVIANSDSEADQQLKLKVRDRILEESDRLFTCLDTAEEAERNLQKSLEELEAIVAETIKSEGKNYSAEVRNEPSLFPTKSYGSFVLPAGKYKSLKIIIGEGKGQNWWCVLFPPLCLPAAEKSEDILSDVLTEREVRLVTREERYEVRFWIVEKLQEFKISHKREG